MHQHANTDSAGQTTTGTTGNASSVWIPNYTPVKKSLSCPYCTPRCPHGYPIETSPTITWTYPYCSTTTQGINTSVGQDLNKTKA